MIIRRILSSVKRRFSKVFTRVKQKYCFDDSRVIYNGKTYKSFWEETYKNDHRSFFSEIKVKRLARRAFIDDGFRPDEFSLYGLEKLKQKEWDIYLSRTKKDRILFSYYGAIWRDIIFVLKDKYVFYSYLKDYFKREATYIKSEADRLSFLSFCEQHHGFFAKLNKGNCGRGARIFNVDSAEKANQAFDELIGSGEWIIEELIIQNPAIAQFNASSINTIRFPSFKKNGVVQCVFPCMRFGRAGSIVDNAGQGGVFVSIDQNSGEIITDAFDEKGNVYPTHPDSKLTFKGFQIPQWDELIDLVKNAHLALPENQVYVAFDLALSEKGWCIVEGNWGDWILQQTSLERGMKKEFVSLLLEEW